MQTCTGEFTTLIEPIKAGGLHCDGSPVVEFHNPFHLLNWTLPVIELMLVAGAIACLVHAIRWYRRQGDMTNIVVWGSLILALVFVEPITYFPWWFGLQDVMGLTFAHGQFSVQFFFDRMPLYIVAMYPVFGYVGFVLVQRTGILTKYNKFVGAAAIAAAFCTLFEVIDSVGPQFGWWIWNTELQSSTPSMGPIPFLSLLMFSVALPYGIGLMTLWVCKPEHRGGWYLARSIVLVSILVWPVLMLSQVPAIILDAVGLSTDMARLITIWAILIIVAAVAAYAFVGAYTARRTDPSLVPDGSRGDYFALVCVAIYLAGGITFWVAALPDNLDAVDGLTPQGMQAGSLTWGVVNFVLAVAITVIAYANTGQRAAVADAAQGSRAAAPTTV